jgi:hypothetical protein
MAVKATVTALNRVSVLDGPEVLKRPNDLCVGRKDLVRIDLTESPVRFSGDRPPPKDDKGHTCTCGWTRHTLGYGKNMTEHDTEPRRDPTGTRKSSADPQTSTRSFSRKRQE